MVDITIVNVMVYKPTYNWGAPSCRELDNGPFIDDFLRIKHVDFPELCSIYGKTPPQMAHRHCLKKKRTWRFRDPRKKRLRGSA